MPGLLYRTCWSFRASSTSRSCLELEAGLSSAEDSSGRDSALFHEKVLKVKVGPTWRSAAGRRPGRPLSEDPPGSSSGQDGVAGGGVIAKRSSGDTGGGRKRCPCCQSNGCSKRTPSEISRVKRHSSTAVGECWGNGRSEYCVRRLNLSEGSVALRIQVANVARRFPQVLASLAEGRISLSVAGRLAPHLVEENVERLLEDCAGMSKRAVEEYLVSLSPKPTFEPSIRKRPSSATKVERNSREEERSGTAPPLEETSPLPSPAPRGLLEPARPELYNFRFAAGKTFKEKLVRLAEVLGVESPEKNMAEASSGLSSWRWRGKIRGSGMSAGSSASEGVVHPRANLARTRLKITAGRARWRSRGTSPSRFEIASSRAPRIISSAPRALTARALSARRSMRRSA